jgi:hypothetical protein
LGILADTRCWSVLSGCDRGSGVPDLPRAAKEPRSAAARGHAGGGGADGGGAHAHVRSVRLRAVGRGVEGGLEFGRMIGLGIQAPDIVSNLSYNG